MPIPPGWKSPAALLLACVALAAFGSPAGAVIIETGDGTGNTSAPPACAPPPTAVCDPGWDHVGVVDGLSGVYIRNGWVLTANHVTSGPITLDGVVYDYMPGTEIQLDNGDGTYPDLKLFGITPTPPLPELPIRADTSLPTGPVIMIGHGKNRGAATDTDDPLVWPILPPPEPQPPDPPIPGWYIGSGRTMRWGVNEVTDQWLPDPYDTVAFFTTFDDPSWPDHRADEAQAATGDSGGGVFAKSGSTWELAGTMLFVGTFEGHVNNSVLRGEATGIADLSFYRDEILSLTAAEPVPEPAGPAGLAAGLGLLLLLHRKRGVQHR